MSGIKELHSFNHLSESLGPNLTYRQGAIQLHTDAVAAGRDGDARHKRMDERQPQAGTGMDTYPAVMIDTVIFYGDAKPLRMTCV
jgi:hypothetical protein